MTENALRQLAAQATPGPWVSEMAGVFSHGELIASARAFDATKDAYDTADRNARLIALAPDMAVLLADAMDALRASLQRHRTAATNAGGGPCICEACQETVALLARFAELEARAKGETAA